MYFHEKPCISLLRGYCNPNGYESRDPYDVVLTIHYLGDDEVFIEGMKGNMSVSFFKELNTYLKNKGITTLNYERNGKIVSRSTNI